MVFPPSTTEVIDIETFHLSGKRKISAVIELSDDEEDDDVMILNFSTNNTPLGKGQRSYTTEKGESSNPNNSPFVCEICTDTKTMKDAFYIGGCTHAYCSDCVVKYIGSKLEDNTINILCPFPGCSGLLEAEFCRSILPVEVFERWGKALCEALFNASEKFYCPFADCSALLINDGTETVLKSECPNCNKIFCAKCKVPWHEGIECSEFEKLNADEREKEDIMLMNFAKDKKWRRCPNCRIYVAKSEGCNSMKCRCSCRFCYNCGVKLLNDRLCSCFTGAVFPIGNPIFPTRQLLQQRPLLQQQLRLQQQKQIPTHHEIHSIVLTTQQLLQQQQQQQLPLQLLRLQQPKQIPTHHEQIHSRVLTTQQLLQQQQQLRLQQQQKQIPTHHEQIHSRVLTTQQLLQQQQQRQQQLLRLQQQQKQISTHHEQIHSRVLTNGVSFNGTFLNGNNVYSTQQQKQIPSRNFTGGISTIATFPNGNIVSPTKQEQIPSRVFTSGLSSSGTFLNGNIVYPTQRQEQIPSRDFTGGSD